MGTFAAFKFDDNKGKRIEDMMVTPEIAAEILKLLYPGQRQIDWGYVKVLSRDMSEGNFVSEAAQNIHISSDGWLIDGQHRLWAIIDSGIPQMMEIKYGGGTAEELFEYKDQNNDRRIHQFIECPNKNTVIAIANVIKCLERGATLTAATGRFVRQHRINGKKVIERATRTENLEYTKKHLDELVEVAQMAGAISSGTKCNKTMAGTVIYLLREMGADKADEYVRDLMMDAPSKQSTTMVQKYLMRRYMEAKAQHVTIDRKLTVGVLLYGYELFKDDRTVKTISKNAWENAYNRFDVKVQDHFLNKQTQLTIVE